MTRRRWAPVRRALVAVLVVAAPVVAATGPAGAAETIVARAVALAPSASCTWGDVDVDYAADGVERQQVTFTAEGGTTLHQFEDEAYLPTHEGIEHVLSETTSPPPAGTAVAVHVLIGTTPPLATTTAEFFVLYRCDTAGNDQGGTNTVLYACYGDYGTCPATADEALAGPAAPGGGGSGGTGGSGSGAPGTAPAATPVSARPTYTG